MAPFSSWPLLILALPLACDLGAFEQPQDAGPKPMVSLNGTRAFSVARVRLLEPPSAEPGLAKQVDFLDTGCGTNDFGPYRKILINFREGVNGPGTYTYEFPGPQGTLVHMTYAHGTTQMATVSSLSPRQTVVVTRWEEGLVEGSFNAEDVPDDDGGVGTLTGEFRAVAGNECPDAASQGN